MVEDMRLHRDVGAPTLGVESNSRTHTQDMLAQRKSTEQSCASICRLDMAHHIPCTLACLDHVEATETNILEPQLMQLMQSSIFHTYLRSIHIPLHSHRHGVDCGFCNLGRHPCSGCGAGAAVGLGRPGVADAAGGLSWPGVARTAGAAGTTGGEVIAGAAGTSGIAGNFNCVALGKVQMN